MTTDTKRRGPTKEGVRTRQAEPMGWALWGDHAAFGQRKADKAERIAEALRTYGLVAVAVDNWADGSWSYHRCHRNIHLIATINGTVEAWFDGRWHEVGKDTIFIAPDHTEHGFRTPSGSVWHYLMLLYDPAVARDLTADCSGPHLRPGDTTGLFLAMQALFHESCGNADPTTLSAAAALIHVVARRLAHPDRRPGVLGRLWSQVQGNLQRPWTTAEMADVMETSEMNLWRQCRASLGVSPKAHVRHLRMQRGAELLLASSESIDEIARVVGYDGQRSFGKAFKRCFGMPPGRYRRGGGREEP